MNWRKRTLLYSILGLILLWSCKAENSTKVAVDSFSDSLSAEVEQAAIKPEEKVMEDLPTIDAVMGKINPSSDSNFVRIDAQYTDKAAIYLQKECYEQFINMHNAAALEGVELFILSATRPFQYQKNIWERKWAKLKAEGKTDEKQMVSDILRYSAMPGTSRHHWGTDIDLNYLNNHYFESGKGKKIYEWLLEHAAEYGFCQPYVPKGEERPYGYEEEKWHWSYMPLAEKYFQVASDSLKNTMIEGFSGAQFAGDLSVVEHYVLGVNPRCK
jgi:D-alanyl-D-alanine carboxypeptidase